MNDKYLRKIDALVAEKVMGWALRDYDSGKVASSPEDYKDAATNDGWTWDGSSEAHKWNPSKSIADAWRVVDALLDHGILVAIAALKGKNVNVDVDMGGGRGWRVNAATAPLAICLAALKALGVEPPEEGEG